MEGTISPVIVLERSKFDELYGNNIKVDDSLKPCVEEFASTATGGELLNEWASYLSASGRQCRIIPGKKEESVLLSPSVGYDEIFFTPLSARDATAWKTEPITVKVPTFQELERIVKEELSRFKTSCSTLSYEDEHSIIERIRNKATAMRQYPLPEYVVDVENDIGESFCVRVLHTVDETCKLITNSTISPFLIQNGVCSKMLSSATDTLGKITELIQNVAITVEECSAATIKPEPEVINTELSRGHHLFIPGLGEFLISLSGDIVINKLVDNTRSFHVSSPSNVILNNTAARHLSVQSGSVFVAGECSNIEKLTISGIGKDDQSPSVFAISQTSKLNVHTLTTNNTMVANVGTLEIFDTFDAGDGNIFNLGTIVASSAQTMIKNIGYLCNKTTARVTSNTSLLISAATISNIGTICSKTLKIFTSRLLDNQGVVTAQEGDGGPVHGNELLIHGIGKVVNSGIVNFEDGKVSLLGDEFEQTEVGELRSGTVDVFSKISIFNGTSTATDLNIMGNGRLRGQMKVKGIAVQSGAEWLVETSANMETLTMIKNFGKVFMGCSLLNLRSVENFVAAEIVFLRRVIIRCDALVNSGSIVVNGQKSSSELSDITDDETAADLTIFGKYIGQAGSKFAIDKSNIAARSYTNDGQIVSTSGIKIFHRELNSRFGKVVSEGDIHYHAEHSGMVDLTTALLNPIIKGTATALKIFSKAGVNVDGEYNANVKLEIFQENDTSRTPQVTVSGNLKVQKLAVKAEHINVTGKIIVNETIHLEAAQMTNTSGEIECLCNIVLLIDGLLKNCGGKRDDGIATTTYPKFYTEYQKTEVKRIVGPLFGGRVIVEHKDDPNRTILLPDGRYQSARPREERLEFSEQIVVLDTARAGRIVSGRELTIHAGDFDNSFGVISVMGGISLTSRSAVTNECGWIRAQGDLTINGVTLRNGHLRGQHSFSTIDPNDQIIEKGKDTQCFITESKPCERHYKKHFKGRHEYWTSYKDIPLRDKGDVDVITGYKEVTHHTRGSRMPGYLFANGSVNISLSGDATFGRIVAGRNITINGKYQKSENFGEHGEFIAYGDVSLEMRKAQAELIDIQAKAVIFKNYEDLILGGGITTVRTDSGDVHHLLDLSEYAKLLGFHMDATMAAGDEQSEALLPISRVRNVEDSGLLGKRPATGLFISSVHDNVVTEVMQFLLTRILGREVFVDDILPKMEMLGAMMCGGEEDSYIVPARQASIPAGLVFSEDTDEEPIEIERDGEKVLVPRYKPYLRINPNEIIKRGIKAEKYAIFESMKGIKLAPTKIEFDAPELSLQAEENISSSSGIGKHGEPLHTQLMGREQLSLVAGKDINLITAGLAGKHIKAHGQNVIFSDTQTITLSQQGDTTIHQSISTPTVIMAEATVDVSAKQDIIGKGLVIKSKEDTNLHAGEKVDIFPTEDRRRAEYRAHRKHGIVDDTVPSLPSIETTKLVVDAPKVTLQGVHLKTKETIIPQDGDLEILPATARQESFSHQTKRRLLSHSSRMTHGVRTIPISSVIETDDLLVLGKGKLKLVDVDLNAKVAVTTKDISEESAVQTISLHVKQKKAGLFPGRLRGDPLVETVHALQRATITGDTIPMTMDAIGTAAQTASHIMAVSKLFSDPGLLSTMKVVEALTARFVAGPSIAHIRQVATRKEGIPEQSKIEIGILKVENNIFHFEGQWNVGKATISTEQLSTSAKFHTLEQQISSSGWSITFSPASILGAIVFPLILPAAVGTAAAATSATAKTIEKVTAMLPTVSAQSGRQTMNGTSPVAPQFLAQEIFIRCNNAVFCGSKIRAKMIDMIVMGDMTIETLTEVFHKEAKNSAVSASLSAIFSVVGGVRIDKSLIDPRLAAVPTMRIANSEEISERVTQAAELIGSHTFFLKVGESLFKKAAEIGLQPDGVIHPNTIDGHVEAKRIIEAQVKQGTQANDHVFNPGIGQFAAMATQIQDLATKINAEISKLAVQNNLSPKQIHDLDNNTKEFLDRPEIKSSIQKLEILDNRLEQATSNIVQAIEKHPDVADKIAKQLPPRQEAEIEIKTSPASFLERITKAWQDARQEVSSQEDHWSGDVTDALIYIGAHKDQAIAEARYLKEQWDIFAAKHPMIATTAETAVTSSLLSGLRISKHVYSIGKTIYDGIKLARNGLQSAGQGGLTYVTTNGQTVVGALEAAPVTVGLAEGVSVGTAAVTTFGDALPLALDMARKGDGKEKSSNTPKSDPDRINPEYGKGKYWDNLTTRKNDKSLEKLSKKTGGEVRFDGKYYYQFDRFHKTNKVHLHKYIREGKNAKLIGDVDPSDGRVIREFVGNLEPWF